MRLVIQLVTSLARNGETDFSFRTAYDAIMGMSLAMHRMAGSKTVVEEHQLQAG